MQENLKNQNQYRNHDLGWILDNLVYIWDVAQNAYTAQGRGAVVIDMTIPILLPNTDDRSKSDVTYEARYFDQEEVSKTNYEEAQKLVDGYLPDTEMVIIIFNEKEQRMNAYRVRSPADSVHEQELRYGVTDDIKQ